MSVQTWNAEGYERNARFVSNYGSAVMDLLAPQAGERILDLGCGDGVLTKKLEGFGAEVVGADSSDNFVEAAKAIGVDARLVDAHELAFDNEFDAVFSNAAMHWMTRPDAVIDGVWRALKPGGRFVAEMGGHGCVAAIDTALRAASAHHGIEFQKLWYFPTDAEYRARLEARGFQVRYAALIPRPTPLPTGMKAWIETFRSPMMSHVPAQLRNRIVDDAVEFLAPVLRDESGQWTADYMRMRFAAVKPLS